MRYINRRFYLFTTFYDAEYLINGAAAYNHLLAYVCGYQSSIK